MALHGDVGQLESRAEDLAADELPVVDDVRVDVQKCRDVNSLLSDLLRSLELLLARASLAEE